MDEAEEFAYKEYLPAIYRGGSQTDKEFTKVAQKFCDLTGLSFSYAKSRRLLVDKTQYAAELLRKKKKVIGCFDSRLYAFTENPTAERVSFDPGDFQGTGPYVAAANHYLRSELKIDMTIPYHFYRNEIWEKWEWTGAPKKGHGFLNMVPMLGREFRKNKNLYLFFATGLYDLVTPYMTAGYTVSQMQLPKSQMYRITNRPYPGGHMFYGNEKALAAFTKDVKNWYQKSSKK